MSSKIIALTKESFDDFVNNNLITFIMFSASWCGPCRNFSHVLENFSTCCDNVSFGRVDIEADRELAEDFSVKKIPHLLIFQKNLLVYSESGLLTLQNLNALLEQTRNLGIDRIEQ